METNGDKMFWADRIASELEAGKRHVVSDAKTPSGRIHVGSLRGVVIHDLVYKALKDAGRDVEFIYRFDDFDPMDGFPAGLDESFRKYMGMPLCDIPSPEPGAASFARLYADEFRRVFESLGCRPKIHWSSENYRSGGMDWAIREALDHAAEIKAVNERVSGTKKEGNWLPINVVCEKCGKIGGTVASGWDGETVEYECRDNKYSTGCHHKARVSPFGGRAKLTWKVDWAATWKHLGVTVEGAGKDHCAAGGSHDVADELSKKIFKYETPYNIPYEHFLVGGKKMSSSKGLGVSLKEMDELLPPEILRFIMTRYKPRTAIDFTPDGDTITKLYSDYDTYGEAQFGRRESRDPDEPRIYAMSQTTEDNRKHPKDYYRPNFALLTYLIQVPYVKVEEVMAKRKGSALTPIEKVELDSRIKSAKTFLARYADEETKLEIVPHAKAVKFFSELPAKQQALLHEFATYLESHDNEDDQWHKIRELTATSSVSLKDFFELCYQLLIGKPKGPKLLPFINALDKQFVAGRLKGVH